MFCINPISTPDLLIGYNKNRDYTLNNYAFSESVNPIEIISFMNAQPHWYNGFSSGITPAFAINFVDSDLVNIKEINDEKIKIYPNPIIENNWLTIENTNEVNEIYVIDISGKVLKSSQIVGLQQEIKINFQDVQKGMYLVKVISNDNQVSTFHVVKQ